jgi:Spy/CpxP family protein refolding chaperone
VLLPGFVFSVWVFWSVNYSNEGEVMGKKIFLIGVLLAGCVLFTSSLRADDKKDAATQIAEMAKEMEKALTLTPEQKEKIKVLAQDFKAKQAVFYSDLKIKRDALKDALDAEKFDRSKADALVADIAALQNKILENRVTQVVKTREMLSPEQFKKLKALREQKSGECSDCKKDQNKKKQKRKK